MYRAYYIMLILSLATLTTKAQEKGEKKIFVRAICADSAITLRWAPTDKVSWLASIQSGYIIIRRECDSIHGKIIKSDLLTKEPIKPWPLQEYEKYKTSQEVKYLGLAAQAVYGRNFSGKQKGVPSTQRGLNFIEQSTEQNRRFGFSLTAADYSALAAEALGLRFVDKNITLGAHYEYLIVSQAPYGQFQIDTGVIKIIALNQPADYIDAPQSISDEHRIIFQFNVSSLKGRFHSLIVSKSEDDGKTYNVITKQPFLVNNVQDGKEKEYIFFIDSVKENYKPYYYKFSGINSFAIKSQPSMAIVAMGCDKTPPPPVTASLPKVDPNNTVHLNWKIKNTVLDFKGFRIERSKNPDKAFMPIDSIWFPVSKTEYTDRHPLEDFANYYRIAASDTAGNISYSMPVLAVLYDSLPPAQPKGFAGSIDSTGLVILHWNPVPDRDLKGYKIYSSERKNGEFTQVTTYPVTDTVFTDTVSLKSLSPKKYYKIIAVDKHNNHSPLSKAITVVKPLKGKIDAPRLTNVVVYFDSVYIIWATSSSPMLKKHVLVRKIKGQDWTVISELPGTSNTYQHYMDKSVQKGVSYQYAVFVTDSMGRKSAYSKPWQANVYNSGLKPGNVALKGEVNKKTKSIDLNWEFATSPNVKMRFVLYRAYKNNPLMVYRTFPEKVHTFTDEDHKEKGVYKYAIKAIFTDGTETRISPETSLQVK